MGKIALILVLSIWFGAVTYFVLGIAIAQIRNEGHFYSFPFGGYAVRDEALLSSAGTWIAVWVVLLAAVFKRKKS